MKTKHEMYLNDKPFTKIKEETKTLELRLNDEKRQLLKIGDLIEFTLVIIENLYKFDSFEELYKHFNKIEMGYDEEETASHKDMEEYYKITEQNKYGVLGVQIKKLKK